MLTEVERTHLKPHQEQSAPSSLSPGSKGHRYTKESARKAIQAKLQKRKESAEFVASLQHQPIELQEFRLQAFLKEHPNKRKEVIREMMEQSLFIRLNHQRSLIASGDPLKKAEARKDDLGIGLEYDKLYKEQESDALTVRIPSALVGRLSGVLALKIAPVDTSSTPVRLDNQVQDGGNTLTVKTNTNSKSVQERTSDNS